VQGDCSLQTQRFALRSLSDYQRAEHFIMPSLSPRALCFGFVVAISECCSCVAIAVKDSEGRTLYLLLSRHLSFDLRERYICFGVVLASYLRVQLGCDRYQRAQHFWLCLRYLSSKSAMRCDYYQKGETLWPCLRDQSADERFAMVSHHCERA
jgi:hypothetical protein